jgi:hypothetical protein
MVKKALIILGKILLLSIVLHLAIFYFTLGWFVIYIWLVGAFWALQITKQAWRNSPRRFVGIILVLGSYVLSIFLVWNGLFNWTSERTFNMVWNDKGLENEWKESEIVLQFADYPQHHIGIYSNELAAYLKNNGTADVQVTFEVTSDLGCMRGFDEKKIGALSKWKSTGGYAEVIGETAEPSPWGSRRWWCP